MAKILHVIDHMGVGGAQRIVVDLAANGLGDYVYAIRRKTTEEIKVTGDTKIFYGRNSLIGFWNSIVKLNQIIRKNDVDIVHCHLRASFFVGLLLASRNKKPKFVFHEQGTIVFRPLFYRSLVSLVSKFGVIIACSEFVGRNVKEVSKKIDVRVVPNFIDLAIFFPSTEKRNEFRESLGFSNQDILIGFAGRLVQEKGWPVLIKAFSQIKKHKRVYLLMAGIGPDMERIKDMLSNETIKNVHLLGYESDMLSFYNGLDIFVMPSLVEPFGLVQVEAQACGVPVIASEIDGVRETLDSTCAVMVTGGDSQVLKNALEKLIDHPDLRNRLSRLGLENAKRFSLERVIREVRKIYLE